VGHLNCMNCRKEVSEQEAKFFTGMVLCCPTCFLMAERLHDRMKRELNALLLMTTEKIRLDLIEGKLHFQGTSDQEIPKEVLLKTIVQLQELKDDRRSRVDVRDSKDQP
jgi:hypothetical protein